MQSESGQQVHEDYIVNFSKKILIYGQMGQFGNNLAQKMMNPYNSESAFRNVLKVTTVEGTGGTQRLYF